MQNNQSLSSLNPKIMINGVTYQKLRKLGQRTERVVYQGQNIETKEFVFIKEYKRINENEQQAIQRIFENNCSHIIGIKGIQINQNQLPIVVMEIANGEFYQLTQSTEYNQLNYQQRNQYFLQMVQGVNQLHELGYFHRDLKPENFVFFEQPNNEKIIKLIDFGLVKETANMEAKTMCVGTPYYIAPEVLQSNLQDGAFYDKSVDVWSLGAIWYEILTGEIFFNGNQQIYPGNNQNEIFNQIINMQQSQIDDKIQQNQILQENEKNFIKRMLKKAFPPQRLQLSEIINAYNLQKNLWKQQDYQGEEKQINDMDGLNRKMEKLKKIQEEAQQKMRNEYEQKLKEFEIRKQEEMEQMKRDIEQQKEQEFSKKINEIQKKQKEEFEIYVQQKEQEIINQHEQSLKQINDNQLLAQLKFQLEMEFQNKMVELKKNKQKEQNKYLEQLKQQENNKKDKEIIQKMQENEKLIKQQLEIEIQNKYMLDYSKQVTDIQNKYEQEKQKELEEKKQSSLVLLQTQQNTIQIFIQNLDQKQQVIKDIDLQNDKKNRLIEDINNQLQKYNNKLQINQQKQKKVQMASQQDQLKGFNNQLAQEIQYDIQEQNTIIQKIQEQQLEIQKLIGKQKAEEQKKEQQRKQEQEKQLEIERKNFREKFGNFKLQFTQLIGNINQIQETIRIYESVQYQIQEKPKITEVLQQQQRMQKEIQVLEYQEKNLIQNEKSQQLANYQFLKIKIYEFQQALIILKNQIDETNKYIEQINSKFVQEHQIQINVIVDNLNDYQDKFKYLSQNQKYANKIQQISTQIGYCFGLLNNLNSLLQQGIFQNYQKFNQTKDSITQNLQDFQNQHNLLVEQIHYDQQIEQRNAERLKKLKIIEGQLNEFIRKMNQLKNQINNFSKNQYFNDEQTRNLILDKQLKIDQNIESLQQEYQVFQKLNQLTSFETINTQINLLEQFQSKLFQILQDEQEKVLQLDQRIQEIGIKNKSVQEKEYLELNNQLQKLQMQFQRSFQQVKLDQDKIDNSKLMNAKTDELKQQLEQEIKTIDEYYKINQDNQQLFKKYINEIQNKYLNIYNKQKLNQKLKELSNYNQDKTVKLNEVYQNAYNQYLQLEFKPLNISLIDNYEQLQQQGEQLSQDINLIDQMAQNQQSNLSSFNELKERMQKLINNLESLILRIPQNNEIEEFNSIYKHYLESFLKLYSLINYLKQYHLTRYYERIKEYANKSKKYQKDNSYIIVFQQRQNEVLEEETRKEKEAQNLLKIYENILFHNSNQKMIEELQRDNQQISNSIEVIENQIKQKYQVKLRGLIKNQNDVKEIINIQQYYKIKEFAFVQTYNTLLFDIKNKNIDEKVFIQRNKVQNLEFKH